MGIDYKQSKENPSHEMIQMTADDFDNFDNASIYKEKALAQIQNKDERDEISR